MLQIGQKIQLSEVQLMTEPFVLLNRILSTKRKMTKHSPILLAR